MTLSYGRGLGGWGWSIGHGDRLALFLCFLRRQNRLRVKAHNRFWSLAWVSLGRIGRMLWTSPGRRG